MTAHRHAKTGDPCDGNLKPIAKPGRVWLERRKKFELPSDMVVTECEVCGLLVPTFSELKRILSWLDELAPIAKAAASLNESLLGGPFTLAGSNRFKLEWPKLKSERTVSFPRLERRRVEHVLRHSFPRAVAMRDDVEGSVRFVGVEVDRCQDRWRWLFVPVSRFAWRGLIEGGTTLKGLFANYTGELEVVDYRSPASIAKYGCLDFDSLPADLRFGEIASDVLASLNTTLEPMEANKRRVAFEGEPVVGHAITPSALDAFMHPFTRILDHFLKYLKNTMEMGFVTPPRLVPVEGSFSLEVETDPSNVFDLTWSAIASIANGIDDDERLKKLMEQDRVFADAVRSLFDGLRSAQLEMYVSTPDHKLHMNAKRAKKIANKLEAAIDRARSEPFHVEGYFSAFNASSSLSHFSLDVDAETSWSGRLSPEVRTRFHEKQLPIIMSPLMLYRATLCMIGSQDRYLLLDATPLGPTAVPTAPQAPAAPDASAEPVKKSE